MPAQPEIVAAAAVSRAASPGALIQAVLFYGAPPADSALAPVALPPSALPASPSAPAPPSSPFRGGAVQQTPILQPTLAEAPADAQAAASTPPQQQATASAHASTRRPTKAKVLHGQVTRVDRSAGHATVDFPHGVPPTGSRAAVYRRQLFQRKHLGEVEIFVTSAGEVCARPHGGLTLASLASEDELIVLPQIHDNHTDLEATESAPQL
jgi:hypothetical protein